MDEFQNDLNGKNEEDEFFDPPESRPQPKRKTARRVAAVLLAIILCVVGFVAGWFGHYYSLDERVRTFLWAKDIVERYYYKEVDEGTLYESLYNVLDLDPYTHLYTPSGYSSYVAQGEGQNAGIGVSIIEETTSSGVLPRLFSVAGNSPAERAGLRKGMYLLGYGVTEEEAAQPRTGGQNAFMTFYSGVSNNLFVRSGYEADGTDAAIYSLARENYQASFCYYKDSETSFGFRYTSSARTPEAAFAETGEPIPELPQTAAYLRLDEFSGYAAEEFALCLSRFKERGKTNLILDLRSDGGGYLDILCDIASHLLKDVSGIGPLVARAFFRDGSTQDYFAYGNDYASYFGENARVLVLADENTASASECLIGALVDHGTLAFGDIFLRENEQGIAKSYGKGIMQHSYTSASGAAMKLTVAEIKWPKGKSIHGVGVVPADGAIPVPAPLVCGKDDPMLSAALGVLAD